MEAVIMGVTMKRDTIDLLLKALPQITKLVIMLVIIQ
jgi:hypothetical protein